MDIKSVFGKVFYSGIISQGLNNSFPNILILEFLVFFQYKFSTEPDLKTSRNLNVRAVLHHQGEAAKLLKSPVSN